MILFPNAKINLGLNILRKRGDGFHDIESVFYPIGWKDALEVIPADSFSFETTGLEIPGDSKNNLILKAFFLLKNQGFLQNTEAKIHLHKVLPMGAGIGGGSADGAFALKLFNSVFELNISESQLETFAAQLGSDCPFFIQNKAKFCYGRGTEFEDIEVNLKDKYLVLVNPQIHISTAEAYASITPKIPGHSIKDIIAKPISYWKNSLVNDFEIGLAKNYPKISQIKNQLYDHGAIYASMTGSGSTVYGIFESEIHKLEDQFSDSIIWQGRA